MIEFIKKHYGKIGMSFALIMLVINYFQRQELAELRSKTKSEVVVGGDIQKAEIIDSLNAEIFSLQTINGRYEMALEILKEDDKKAADKFELILSTQTE